MRYLEVRRHTMRVKPGSHLSQAGVTLARKVGEEMNSFDLVVTSTLPRAYETAIAMGFAVQEEYEQISTYGDAVEREIDWDAGFASIARTLQSGTAPAAVQYAEEVAALWLQLIQRLPEGGAALAISHGGVIELGTIGCLPNLDYTDWGASCDYCEGVRLIYGKHGFIDAEVLRV